VATTISTLTTISTSRPSSARPIDVAGMPAFVVLSTAADGDMGPRASDGTLALRARRQALVPGHWRWLRQCHGDGVVVLGPHESCEGREADAMVSTVPGEPLAVFAADCALVGLVSPEGVVAAVHVGWRSLLAGVLEHAVEEMTHMGASAVFSVVGACIGAECYEFGEDDLSRLEARYGPCVRGNSAQGRPALDLRLGIAAAMEPLGVESAAQCTQCTACDEGWFSWRARKDTCRQALVVVGAS